jgi:hypothetical protein
MYLSLLCSPATDSIPWPRWPHGEYLATQCDTSITIGSPNNPYFVLLSRAERRPRLEIWPLSLRTPIPRVPVPLRRPDPDVALDITAALQQIYTSARYERRINYRDDPPLPDFADDDLAWIDAHLRERGLRP